MKQRWILFVICLLLSSMIIPSQQVFAPSITVSWNGSTTFDLNSGGLFPGTGFLGNLTFSVHDDSFIGGNPADTIQVLVNSTTNPSGIILTLTESPGNNGDFVNHDLIFTNGTQTFAQGSTQTVGIHDNTLNTNSSKAETIVSGPSSINGIEVLSSSTPADQTDGIFLNLTETGPNTGIFSNNLKFTSTPSVNGSSIQAIGGDIVSIINLNDLTQTNELVTPNPDPAVGALSAKVGDEVDVVYHNVKDVAHIVTSGGLPGGGGGGLIRPGLVLDILAAIGGSSYIVSPPSFGGSYYHYSDGFTLKQADKKETFDISGYNNEIPKQVLVSGTNTSMTFKTFESYNPQAIVHMGLYLIPRGQDMITPNSIASIVWDKNSHLEVNDPGHILSNATADSVSDGKFQYTKFNFVPTKSYDKMSFLARAWNDHLYSTDVRLHDAVDTPEPTKTLPAGTVRYDNFADLQTTLEKDGFYNPNILNHIRDTKSVFGSTGYGCVYWLYDTINHTVTLVIEDKDENNLASITRALEPFAVEKKGDYKFMHFTVKQLNGWNDQEIKDAMQSEASKAMASALEKGIMPHSNW